jgi:precorrin-2 methylase
MKKGSLTVVGSGIKSVGHLTIEAQGWIRHADVVLYCVADPATEVWIKQNSQYSIDLYQFYGNDKKRLDTYIDMADEMLKYVRKNKDVCGVFYGHPGVFVYPSHRAVQIAREEGYNAAILPAISALDCLFADCGVDPSSKGSQTVEATDMLLRKRKLTTDGHVVVWQIGCVGDLGFNFAGYDNRNLNILVDYLEEFYKPDHEVVHYQGSQYPMCPSVVERMRLDELRHAAVTGISTLYIPPQDELKTDLDMARRLGLVVRQITPAQAEAQRKGTAMPQRSIDRNASHASGTRPEAKKAAGNGSRYYPSPDRSGLATFIANVCEDPSLLAEFMREPALTADTFATLTPGEREALLSKHPGRIRMAIKHSSWEDPRATAADATIRLHREAAASQMSDADPPITTTEIVVEVDPMTVVVESETVVAQLGEREPSAQASR